MGWPYEFLTLTDEEKAIRRETLDHYAAIAHYSAFIPPIIALLVRLTSAAISRLPSRAQDTGYRQIAGSPDRKAARLSTPGVITSKYRKFTWWLGDDVYLFGSHWGHRDQWLFGALWTGWLLLLCVLNTGHDYLHLTKRFGAVAAGQLPIQYALSLKFLNPYAWAFSSSHEVANRWHRVLGRCIYTLVLLHLALYNYFFLASSIWTQRFFAPVVFCGVLASLCLHGVAGTAATAVRAWSYRVFFITHLMAAFAIPPLIFLHAPPVRLYVGEALFLFLLDFAARKLTTVTAPVTAEQITSDSPLVKITLTVPSHKLTPFQKRPGSHIYVNIPPAAQAAVPVNSPLYNVLYNPFSFASTAEGTSEGETATLTLVARTLAGPMTQYLSALASASASTETEIKPSLDIEGPYGSAGRNFASLLASGASRVLLIAGGVGGTFAVPCYHALKDVPHLSSSVQLVWAIRDAADATWAMGDGLLEDEQVHLYLTGTERGRSDSVELDSMSEGRGRSRKSVSRRPELGKIVDNVFRQGGEDTIAVMVCGPKGMARELRGHVRPWVMRGRSVWWHDETFGW